MNYKDVIDSSSVRLREHRWRVQGRSSCKKVEAYIQTQNERAESASYTSYAI